jgi:phosphoribosylformylglycinamidine cyclo-ligase
VFNCGIGLVVAVSPRDAERATRRLRRAGETVFNLGTVERGRGAPAASVL